VLHCTAVESVIILKLCLMCVCSPEGRSLGNMYGPGTGRIWLDDVVCFGHETELSQCRHRWWGGNNCQHSNDVSIACDNRTYGENGFRSFRNLVGNAS